VREEQPTRWRLAKAALLLLCVQAPATAAAYRTAADDLALPPPVRQPGDVLDLHVVPGGPLGTEDLMAAARAASGAWLAPCAAVRFGSVVSASQPASDADGLTTIQTVFAGWEARGYAPTQAAITEVRYAETASGWEISDADVFVNAETIDWSAPGAPDLRAVLVHELGHVLGIAHPCTNGPATGAPACSSADFASTSIMVPDYQAGAWQARSDDLAALCATYPRVHCPDVACAADEVCDGAWCVPACPSGEPCPTGLCAEGGPAIGSCVPPAVEGAPCMVGQDCQSLLCLTSMSAGSFCTRTCATDAECHATEVCREVEGVQVCAPPRRSGSCSVAAVDRCAGVGPLLAGLAWMMRRAKRSRR